MDGITLDNSHITHVSDTALWVAVYRAMESKRPDALFNDPYAEILAGEKGKHIVDGMQYGRSSAWSMIVRTAVMDEFIYKVIKEDNVNTVINLACGLDSRPYRLDLSEKLRWIEVDFPDMIAYKTEKLAGMKPRCRLERVELDLRDSEARGKLLDRINAGAGRALVITEGLLVYLKQEDVASLATDLHAQQNLRWWMLDILSPELLGFLKKRSFRQFTEGNVVMQFAPEGGAEFFRRCGWDTDELRSVLKEARRLNRKMPMAWFYRLMGLFATKKQKEFFSKLDSYFVLLKREESRM